tara:strand:+ start:10032 stop:10388 length:357 start_codon:yes stop_codon:yes gene_type:complete
MALFSTQAITDSGIHPLYGAVEETSNTFNNTGQEFLVVRLSSGDYETVTVTVNTQVTSIDTDTYGTLTKSNATDTVAAGQTIFIGPFPVGAFSTAEGVTTFTVSSVLGVSVGVFSLIR